MLERVFASGATMAMNCCPLQPYGLFMWYFRRTAHRVKGEDKTKGEWVAIMVRRTFAMGTRYQHKEVAVRSLKVTSLSNMLSKAVKIQRAR